MRLATLVLAAGKSTRMGQNKQLLFWGDQNFLEVTCQKYLQFSDVFVILGHDMDYILKQSQMRGVTVVYNPNYEQGMGSSVQAGIQALNLEYDGLWMAFCDMPHIKESTLQTLYEEIQHRKNRIVQPVFQGKRGHPAYIPRRLFKELERIDGDYGARYIIKKRTQELDLIDVQDQAVIEDLDNMALYQKVQRREGKK